MKNLMVMIICSLFLLLFVGCPDVKINNEDNPNNPNNPDGNIYSKYGKEYLGEWIRMDTGERWYISGNTISINGVTTNKSVTFTKTAEQVITVKEDGSQDYLLFASRVADARFNAHVVFINGNNNASRSLVGNDGERPPIIITNPQQPEQPPITVIPDPNTGEFEVPGQIPGDKIIIVPDDPEWNEIIVELIPWDDQNMGIIPLTKGVNLKATIRMANPAIDISELYADGTSQNYVIEVENIGDANCIGASYEISWDESDFNLISGNTLGTLDTIIPGGKKQINMSLASKHIVNEYKNKEIKVTIVSYNIAEQATVRWDDIVSVNYYRESVPFRFKSQRPVQGVVRSPRNKTYYFKTSGTEGNYTTTLNLPWLSDDYVVAFLGASVTNQSETKYSIAAYNEPRSDWESFWGEDMFSYESVNKSPNTAPLITLTNNDFMYYLYTGAVQFFKLNLGDGISLNKYHVSLPVGESETLHATVHPKRTTSQSVIWSSSNNDVAVVDGSGNVTALSAGTAKITATSVACNKVSECVVSVYEISYSVSYNKNAINATGTMQNSNHVVNTYKNLNNNEFINPGNKFVGWALSPSGTVVYTDRQNVCNLTTVAGATITLYAIWAYHDDYNDFSGDIVDSIFIIRNTTEWNQALTTIRNGGNGRNYVMDIISDFSISGTTASTFGNAAGITVLIRGYNSITLSSNGSLLVVSLNQNVIIRDITLKGRASNNASVISVGGVNSVVDMRGNSNISGNTNASSNSGGGGIITSSTFIMRDNASISNNTSSSSGRGGGVYVSSGNFTMMDNASISNNTSSSSGGGVYSLGNFSMIDNTSISNNTSSSGGGVYVSSGNFSMIDNASISNNTSSSSGGGVYISYSSNSTNNIFLMEDNASIYGNNSSSTGGGIYITSSVSMNAFRISGGTIYGNEAVNGIYRNFASSWASLYPGNLGICQYGIYDSNNNWVSGGNLSGGSNTIWVENGVLK